MITVNTLANRIHTARKQAGLTQAEVARVLRVSASAVNQWETGLSKNIKLEHFFLLAELLKQDAQWLATGTVFPARYRIAAQPPQNYPAEAACLGRQEKALLHHFRRLPPTLQKHLLKFVRGLGGLPVTHTEVPVDEGELRA